MGRGVEVRAPCTKTPGTVSDDDSAGMLWQGTFATVIAPLEQLGPSVLQLDRLFAFRL